MTEDEVRSVLRANDIFDSIEITCNCTDPPWDVDPDCYYVKNPREQFEMRIAFILSEVNDGG